MTARPPAVARTHRRAARGLSACLALLALVAGCSGDGGAGEGTAATTVTTADVDRSVTSTTAVRSGPERPTAVGVRTESFVDASRVTDPGQGRPVAPDRTLETTIWYPADGEAGDQAIEGAAPALAGGPYPLVVFAHGFNATAPAYGPVLERLAAAGYVVAAPTFPLSSSEAAVAPVFDDYVQQPADVAFVLGEVLSLAEQDGSGLEGLVDAERIALGGHSLGAATVLAASFNACCDDDRVDATFAVAGFQLPFGDSAWFPDGDGPPLLLVHGDDDTVVPHASSREVFDDSTVPVWFLTLVGGVHTPFGDAGAAAMAEAVERFLDGHLRDDGRALASLDDVGPAGVAVMEERLTATG